MNGAAEGQCPSKIIVQWYSLCITFIGLSLLHRFSFYLKQQREDRMAKT